MAEGEAGFFDYESKSRSLEKAAAAEILSWAAAFFGPRLCMSTSFQLGGLVLLDMLARLQKDLPREKRVPILFVDTGFHFPETLDFQARVTARFGLNLVSLKPVIERKAFERIYGDERLYERNPTECCRINKVEPMQRALRAYRAQIVSLRRDSGAERAAIQIVERRRDGFYMIHPLANWTRRQALDYLKENDLPLHPLHEQGYKSIGCFPSCCTQPVGEHAPERAGRWTGTGKSECGLHLVERRRPVNDFSI